MPILQGTIKDKDTGEAIPHASLTILDSAGKSTGTGTTSNATGIFYIDSIKADYPNFLEVTHVSYRPFYWELTGANENGDIQLEKKTDELDTVIVTAAKKKQSLMPLLLLGLAVAATQQKKSVGEIKTSHVLTAGVAAALIFGFKGFMTLLEDLGLKKSKEEKEVEQTMEDPTSYWNPLFFQKAPGGTVILTVAKADEMIDALAKCFGMFDDDEARAIGILKSVKTQAQLSFLSWRFYQRYATDFLYWLRGDVWPNDRLSAEEIKQVDNYVSKLPKYVP